MGYYCKNNADTCTGECDPSCLKCIVGSASTDCTQCSPLSGRGYLGPENIVNGRGSCGGSKFIFLFY